MVVDFGRGEYSRRLFARFLCSPERRPDKAAGRWVAVYDVVPGWWCGDKVVLEELGGMRLHSLGGEVVAAHRDAWRRMPGFALYGVTALSSHWRHGFDGQSDGRMLCFRNPEELWID